MIKIYTSYFYKIRFFEPYMIPCSTAMRDPSWYKNPMGTFIDKRGVLNGLRANVFVPGPTCQNDCRGPENCNYISDNCAFLSNYRKQLDALDFDRVINMFEDAIPRLEEKLNLNRKPVFVLMVYEKPDNPCSERKVIHEWFADQGFPIAELEV